MSIAISQLRPHKAEAIHRIRLNALSLVTLLVLSYLLPLPSVPAALQTVLLASTPSGPHQAYSFSQVWVWACIIEMGMVTVMGYNLLEAAYAIKYPPAPLPPVPPKALHKSSSASPSPSSALPALSPSQPLSKSQRPFKVLSPHSSPQPQRPFAYNPSSSLSLSRGGLDSSSPSSASPKSPSRTGGAASATPYAQSPISTPSRVLHYTVPPSASTASNVSTSSEFLATPSPVISAYRGKHVAGDVGRALDGSYLSMLKNQTQESDDEE
ncbi:hypothetical protein CVT25_007086 [Psilocybe cyanescens]|uniref:Uncharacterized protein n=1 Tax=Psilocybe cyanescens TaxID=93625 RepID=A0A409XRN8_PSICY|nr:hypothetical protein CVT25_007086 [Psilocybe cyanescens]